MKNITDKIFEVRANNSRANMYVKNLRKLNLGNFLGLYDWKVDHIIAKDVLGKDIYDEIAKYEEDYQANVDKDATPGDYTLLNNEKYLLKEFGDKLKIEDNKVYYIAYVISNNNPYKDYYLAVSTEYLDDNYSKTIKSLKLINNAIKVIKDNIMIIGHSEYFPEEIYNMLMELYEKEKISDPKDWI